MKRYSYRMWNGDAGNFYENRIDFDDIIERCVSLHKNSNLTIRKDMVIQVNEDTGIETGKTLNLVLVALHPLLAQSYFGELSDES